MMNRLLKIAFLGLVIGCVSTAVAKDEDKYKIHYDENGSATVTSCPKSKAFEGLRETIVEIMLVKPDQDIGGSRGSDEKYKFLNNIDSVRENQNKIRINAGSRAVAVGQRAVALAMESTKDVEELSQEVKERDDMLRMLKGIAKLQAQHLQKTSAITAMRAKIMELNAIDNIIAGDIYAQTATSK